jgi:recombination protein RecT
MAKPSDIGKAMMEQSVPSEGMSLSKLLSRIDIRGRFEEMLGKRAPGFISSIIACANTNALLKAADPRTIVSAAAMAATLDLPINPSLGFAHIVPYKDGKDGITRAQFQMGWKGFVQLAMRTAQYKTMNAAEIYEGELKSFNRVTGEIDLNLSGKKSDNVIGYVAFFRLLNGFEKYLYMSREDVERHGKRYSKSYAKGFGPWVNNFLAMALKTVLKLLLSKYGVLSIEMQRAIQADQGVIVDAGKPQDEIPEVEHVDTPLLDGQVSSDDPAGSAQEPVDDSQVLGAKA